MDFFNIPRSVAPRRHLPFFVPIVRYISKNREKCFLCSIVQIGSNWHDRTFDGEPKQPHMAERRNSTRFRLSLPVHGQSGSGMTRDISTSGLFFETEETHSMGDFIKITVDFNDAALQCEGRVVRVEEGTNHSKIAVAFTSYGFA